MSRCEHCGAKPLGDYDLHDYCATCFRNLCAGCMKEEGCCGKKPAVSGQAADDTPICPECTRSIGHARSCSKASKPKAKS